MEPGTYDDGWQDGYATAAAGCGPLEWNDEDTVDPYIRGYRDGFDEYYEDIEGACDADQNYW